MWCGFHGFNCRSYSRYCPVDCCALLAH
jgi:hypothetical protein